MLSLPPSVRIYLCVLPVDMRRSFDSLAGLVREHLGQDPMSGHLFVFRNREEDKVKILYWDRDGYAIWYKRLEKGTFSLCEGAAGTVELDGTSFSLLLTGLTEKQVRRQSRYAREAATV
jgi:transposase